MSIKVKSFYQSITGVVGYSKNIEIILFVRNDWVILVKKKLKIEFMKYWTANTH